MTPKHFELHAKLDEFKPGLWYLWSAMAEMDDGSFQAGTVQADQQGEMIAADTWEGEDES